MVRRIAVVTGAGTGIGRAIAGRLLEDGYAVVGIGRRLEALEDAALSFEAGRREHFHVRTGDVREPASLVDAMSPLARIDAVVANAGIVRQARLGDACADDVWRAVLSTNLDGVFNTLHAAESRIASPGRIVVVSSGLGKLGRDAFGAYCASKHGILGLMKCLSKELAHRRITVNAVCPGWVQTDMARADVDRMAHVQRRASSVVQEDIVRGIALRRFVEPEEVADLVAWLVSERAAAITGEALNISGGEFFA